MTYADSAPLALEITAACAVVALLTRVLTKDGAVAAFVVGACVSAGFGLPGLAVLGTFFVVGTLATRIGWATKKARGTAEAGEGRRDWKRVLGKGGVAAGIALVSLSSLWPSGVGEMELWSAFGGSLAAALADTLATEIGSLSSAAPRTVPRFRRVAAGTPGAVTIIGLGAAVLGGAAIAVVAFGFSWNPPIEEPPNPMLTMQPASSGWSWNDCVVSGGTPHLVLAGALASLAESLAVGLGLRAPGFVRNVFTTLVGAAIAVGLLHLAWGF